MLDVASPSPDIESFISVGVEGGIMGIEVAEGAEQE